MDAPRQLAGLTGEDAMAAFGYAGSEKPRNDKYVRRYAPQRFRTMMMEERDGKQVYPQRRQFPVMWRRWVPDAVPSKVLMPATADAEFGLKEKYTSSGMVFPGGSSQ